MRVASASALVCTYNRAARLRETLAALQAMTEPAGFDAEIVVVDNNSTDETEAAVFESALSGPLPVRYLREPAQGKSFALNLGLAHARGDVLALTDDDVVPSKGWLNRIVADFRARDVSFVFGKVLPIWGVTPPPELLTVRGRDVWGPLAIVDYGDAPLDYLSERVDQLLPIGANVAFARSALQEIGGWRTDLGKVDNTLISGEDHEIFMRLRRCGRYAGYYDPLLTVRHHVPPSRLTRRYFRRWFFWHGRTEALMLDAVFPELDVSSVPRILRVPRFLFRQCFEQCRRYLTSLAAQDALGRMKEELSLLQYFGLFYQRWMHARREPGGPATQP